MAAGDCGTHVHKFGSDVQHHARLELARVDSPFCVGHDDAVGLPELAGHHVHHVQTEFDVDLPRDHRQEMRLSTVSVDEHEPSEAGCPYRPCYVAAHREKRCGVE